MSFAVVGVALYAVIAKSGDEAARQWAVGAIAFVMGYYLRGSEPEVPR
ncbi:MAG TPA: hypothetical protein VGM86_03315 [Thermoanaerobaculia bacterium]